MNKIPLSITSKVLTIGADYTNHRGGIGAIIGTYNLFYEAFKFIPSFRPLKNDLQKSIFFFKQLFVILNTLIRDKQIKIIHLHGSHSGSFFRKLIILSLVKLFFRKKIIYHLHSSSFDIFYQKSNGLTRKLVRHMMKQVDLLVCLSQWWKNFYETSFDLKSICIINNVVDEPMVSLELDKKDTVTINFLFLGRIGNRKGIFDLIDVISNNAGMFNGKMKLYIGGDGELDKLKDIINQQNLHNIVEYIGWVDDLKKKEYLKKSHIYILPSYNEGLPVSILEAMSYGLPIISTNIGGTPEVLENNVNGFIFNPGDKESILTSINYFLNNKQKISEFGLASFNKAQPYLPSAVSKQLIYHYTELLK